MRLLLSLAACVPAEVPVETAPAFVPPGCGDGVLADDEECDYGAENSDTSPGFCRTDCLLPACGDGVVDQGEACDDGGLRGGDGCDVACAVEDGAREVEPNDAWDEATPTESRAYGALPAGDTDCWSFDLPRCGAVEVREAAPCGNALTLALHDPDGALVAVGAPGEDGCAALDPADQPGARWVAEGTWSVCVSAVAGAETPGYALTVEPVEPATLDVPAAGADLDGDGEPDSCDADRDADGLDDVDDDCPEVGNGPATPAPALSANGFVRHWLGAGAFTTGTTTGECRPSDDVLVGEDAPVQATLGDPAGDLVWTAQLLAGESFDMLGPWGSTAAPREAYVLVYLRSEAARPLTLAVGADDGLFAWWNGAQVLDVGSCQGVNADQFTAGVDVVEGWNTLLLKVRDWGGGWGVAARLLDPWGAPVTDLEPSLLPGESWIPGQGDRDGDGLGDLCDPEP